MKDKKGASYIVAVVFVVFTTVVLSLILWEYLTSASEPLTHKIQLVGVKVSENNGNHIELSYIGGKFHQNLNRLIISGTNSNGDRMRFYSSANSSHSTPTTAIENLVLNNPPVGAVICTNNGTIGADHITVTAEFRDGTKVVVLDVLV